MHTLENIRERLGDLLRAVGTGDQSAFAELYDLTSARVYSFASRLAADQAQAEQITQAVFLEFWRTAPRFEASGLPVQVWLLAPVYRHCLQATRAAAAPPPVAHDIAASSSVLVRLAAVHLAWFDKMTQSDIASLTGESISTVKSCMRSGLDALRAVPSPSTREPSVATAGIPLP